MPQVKEVVRALVYNSWSIAGTTLGTETAQTALKTCRKSAPVITRYDYAISRVNEMFVNHGLWAVLC